MILPPSFPNGVAILIHGLTQHSSTSEFIKLAYDVVISTGVAWVAPDINGHGRSSRLGNPNLANWLDVKSSKTLLDDVFNFIGSILSCRLLPPDIPFVLVTNSFGGHISNHIEHRITQKYRDRFRGVALVAYNRPTMKKRPYLQALFRLFPRAYIPIGDFLPRRLKGTLARRQSSLNRDGNDQLRYKGSRFPLCVLDTIIDLFSTKDLLLIWTRKRSPYLVIVADCDFSLDLKVCMMVAQTSPRCRHSCIAIRAKHNVLGDAIRDLHLTEKLIWFVFGAVTGKFSDV